MRTSGPRGNTPIPERTVIKCGRLIDGTGEPERESVAVITENERISCIVPLAEADAFITDNTVVIEALNKTVMPGMMDLHVHLAHGVTDPREPHILYGILSSTGQMLTLWAARNAYLMLEAGFTTVRDFASFYNSGRNPEVLALRDGVELGLVPGPRVFAGGWVSSSAGHRDMFPPRTWPREYEGLADGPWAVRRTVRQMVRDGVDFIKTATSGGAGGHSEEIWWPNYTDEEMRALVEESHGLGRRVATHSHTAESVKRAIRAGVDTIEHGIYMDQESIELMAEHNAVLVPTLAARSPRALEHRRKAGSPPEVLRKFSRAQEWGNQSFQGAHNAGVMVAMGTDTGRGLREYFGKNAYELTLMVGAGLSPMEAIVAATRNSAIGLGQEADLGTLEPEKFADFLVVDGNPLEDISILEDTARIEVVAKSGTILVDRRSQA